VGVTARWKTTKNGFPSMVKRMQAIAGKAVEVGVFKGEHAWLAPIHEYGLDIVVTPAMRAYLHGQGLHLKDSTTHIHIPERSFLRAGYDAGSKQVMQHAQLLMADVAAGKLDVEAFFDAVGMELVDIIKDYAIDLKNPANHPFTIDNKGSSNPLVSTGDMIEQGITWRKA